MASLNTSKRNPMHRLDRLRKHEVAVSDVFPQGDPSAAKAWQRRVRSKLRKVLNVPETIETPSRPRVVGRVQRRGYARLRVLLNVWPGSELPVYVLVPNGITTPRPVVLALHGHGYGAREIVGLWEDGSERQTPRGYQRDFACALAERGFVVVAPELLGFGDLRSDLDEYSTCHRASAYAISLGYTLPGLRVADAWASVKYAQTMPEADASRIGVMGISGGGMIAFYTAAVEPQVRACVVSGYFCNTPAGIHGSEHCFCNYVPGLLRLGDFADLSGLIAPRPMLVEAADHDEIFSIAAVRATVRQARRCWRTFDRPNALQTDYFEDSHAISGAKAYGFLSDHLR